MFTAHSVAKVYGALANGGIVDGARILSSDIVDHIFNTIKDERHFLHNEAKRTATRTVGPRFCTLGTFDVHDPRVKHARRCIYHSGMSFSRIRRSIRNLAVCVFSNEPLAKKIKRFLVYPAINHLGGWCAIGD